MSRLTWMGMQWPEGWTSSQIVDSWRLAEAHLEDIESETGRVHSTPITGPSARDYAWVASQIGDVPTRWIHGHRTIDDFGTECPVGYMDASRHYIASTTIPEAGPYGEGIL